MIPPGANVRQVPGSEQLRGLHGDRLYCVYAEAYASTPGDQAWAGVGWSYRDDDSGDGLFVEHHAMTESSLEHDLHLSLADMSEGRGGRFGGAAIQTAGVECTGHPACALVIATYSTQSWARWAR